MKYRVVHSQDVFDVMRFEGGYHNADANIYDGVIKKHSSHNLSYYCSEIFTSGRNKRVYTRPEFGYPFLSNSDVVSSNPFMSCKYSSKKYGYDEGAVLKSGMIVTGRVGAIGQTAFIPAYLEKAKAMGSDNIIRIVVKPQYKNGFIYAYLASKVGNLSFWKHATGGVQPFITDAMVGNLPIPDLPESFASKINDLVIESSNLRTEAVSTLEKAVSLFESIIGESKVNLSYNCQRINSKAVFDKFCRFDSQFQIGKSQISLYPHTKKITDIAKRIFIGNRGKRNYVAKGVPFLSSSDMMLANPLRTPKNISKNTSSIADVIVYEGDILISRSGTVGNTVIVGKNMSGAAVSEHAMRLVVDNSKIAPEYVYAYFMTKHGQDALQVLPYGSVIITLGEEFLGDIDLPIVSERVYNEIVNLIKEYVLKSDKSVSLENQAIDLIEQEIEKWNN